MCSAATGMHQVNTCTRLDRLSMHIHGPAVFPTRFIVAEILVLTGGVLPPPVLVMFYYDLYSDEACT